MKKKPFAPNNFKGNTEHHILLFIIPGLFLTSLAPTSSSFLKKGTNNSADIMIAIIIPTCINVNVIPPVDA